MPERITKIVMHGFRGVPQTFEVECPDACSLAVLGDNARGKSTIADALEWYFTGSIEFLRKEGREHAIQHISPDREEPTSVEVFTTGAWGGRVEHPDNRSRSVTQIGTRETFLLRGRTLSDFVNKPKAEKWNSVVAILGLEQIDAYHSDLQRARNELRNAASDAATNFNRSESPLLARYGIPIATSRLLLMIQQQCQAAGIPPPASIEAAIDPQWADSLTGFDEGAQRSVFLDGVLSAVRTAADTGSAEAIEDWNKVVSSGGLAQLPQLTLMQAAEGVLRSYAVDACPLCGQVIDNAQLRTIVSTTLNTLRGSAQAMQGASQGLNTIVSRLRSNDEERKRQVASCTQRQITIAAPPEPPIALLEKSVQQRTVVPEPIMQGHVDAVKEWRVATEAALSAGADGGKGG